MENHEKQVSGLTLKDLCLYLLRRRKPIIISFLIFSILLAAYGGLSLRTVYPSVDTAALDEKKATMQTDIDTLKSTLREKMNLLQDSERELETVQDQFDNISQTILKREDILQSQKNELTVMQQNYDVVGELLSSAQELYESTKNDEVKASLLEQIRSASDRQTALLDSVVSLKLKIIETEEAIRELGNTKSLELDIEQLTSSVEDLQNDIFKVQDDIQSAEDNLLDFDKLYTPSPVVPTLTERVENAVKMGIIGFILGLVLSCGVFFLTFYFSPYVLNDRELAYLVNTTFSPSMIPSQFKGFCGLIDRWDGCFPEKDLKLHLKLLADNLSIKSKDVVITGTGDPDVMQELVKTLLPLMEEGCRLSYIANPVYNPSLISSMQGKSILFVETVNRSRKKDITTMVRLITSYNIPVIGALSVK